MSPTRLNSSASFCNLFFQSSDRRQYTALEWKFFLTLHLSGWDHLYADFFYPVVLRIKPRALCTAGKCSAAELHPYLTPKCPYRGVSWWQVSLAGLIEASIAWNAQFSVVPSRGYLRILYFFLHSLSGPGDHGFNLVSRSLLCPSSACVSVKSI